MTIADEYEWGRSLKEILLLSRDPFLAYLCAPVYVLVNVAVTNYIGDEKMLAGLGLGTLTLGIVIENPSQGFAYAVAKCVAQAYGNKDMRMCRVYRNQYLLLCALFILTLCIPIAFIDKLLATIGQEKELITYATKYIWAVVPGLFFHNMGFVQSVYAESMRRTHVRRDATALSALVHLIGVFVLVYIMDKGFEGVCIATSITFASRFIITNILVWKMERAMEIVEVPVRFFSYDTLRNIDAQLLLGFQSMGMSVWGYWALDIFTLMASYLSVEAIAAQTIMRSLGLYTYMLPVGLATTASTLIGNAIGAEEKLLIKHYYKILMTLALFIGLVEAGILYLTRDLIIKLFANERVVQQQIEKIWYIFLGFVVADSLSSVAANCVRASGKQIQGCVLTFVTFFCIGLPVAYLTAWGSVRAGLSGIQFGLFSAISSTAVCYIGIFAVTDWDEIISEKKKITEQWKEEEPEDEETKALLQ